MYGCDRVHSKDKRQLIKKKKKGSPLQSKNKHNRVFAAKAITAGL